MLIEVSNGEIVDKYTILKIKFKKAIPFSEKYFNIEKEYHLLKPLVESMKLNCSLINELESINIKLWQIEDDIRLCEKENNFGPKFIELARLVYITNDQRFLIKQKINVETNSSIKEEKILPTIQ
jgi:hypothetical protein